MNETQRFSSSIFLAGILAIVILMALPLLLIRNSEFGGSDGVGSEIVADLAPDYDAEWISNVWEPPGGETESMLFAMQAAVGGVLIGYCFGFLRGRKMPSQQQKDTPYTGQV